MTDFDAVVIGAGQAGTPLAVRLAKAGRRTALIERRRVGGTCVNDGCIPTKALVASARAAWVARHAGEWGVRVGGEISVDMKAVKARKDAIVESSIVALTSWIAGTANLEWIEGEARFESPTVIRVGERRIEAKELFLDTGGQALVPPIPGLAEVPFLTNVEMMAVDTLPEHLIVLGGSYIGLEFAQMFRRFGSAVTVVEKMDRLVPREDEDVSAALHELLVAEGIDVRTSAGATAVRRDGGGVAVTLEGGDTLRGSHLLVAIGRVPNSKALGLEHAGVATDAHGFITVDDQLRTNVPHIWALGEVNGRGAFTHTSYNDYEIVAENLLDGASRRVTDRIPIYGLFTDPPLGRVGISEHEARASGRRILVGKRPMTRVGRAHERGETRGFIKLIADAETRRILGAAILGIEGDEAVHVIAGLMYTHATLTTLAHSVFAHPTVSELLPTVAGEMK